MLAVVAEGLLVEGLQDDLDLLFKKLAVGVLVDERRPKCLDLSGLVAAADAKDQPAASQDIAQGEVFSQAQRVPHGDDVECRAELEVLGVGRQMGTQQSQVGDALVAFPLKVVLGHPQTMKTRVVHLLGQSHGVVVGLGQLLVTVAARVGVSPVGANIF